MQLILMNRPLNFLCKIKRNCIENFQVFILNTFIFYRAKEQIQSAWGITLYYNLSLYVGFEGNAQPRHIQGTRGNTQTEQLFRVRGKHIVSAFKWGAWKNTKPKHIMQGA